MSFAGNPARHDTTACSPLQENLHSFEKQKMTDDYEKNNKILAKTEKMYYICSIDSLADAQ
jgi:hypothetical protein